MDVGFIGIGRMGVAMVPNLLRAGHRVTVYNRTRERAEILKSYGATIAGSIADACRTGCVISMLADDEALEQVAFGSDPIVANLARGGLHISCGTISVDMAERLTERHTKADQRFVSAPVFGRPDAAASRRLIIVAAGAGSAIQSAMPLLSAMGQRTFTVSQKPKDANLVKLSGNFLIASVMESIGEALALVSKAGLDRQQYIAMLTSTLFDAPIYKSYGGLIASENFEPAGFAAHLGLKDISLILSAAEDIRVPMPLASLLRDRFLTLLAHKGDQLDWSAIGRLPALDAAVK